MPTTSQEVLAMTGELRSQGAAFHTAPPVYSEEDIQASPDVLRSDWLTTGPQVAEFRRSTG